MNILVPLRDFTPGGNTELRFMLRGIEQYLQEDISIHIISKNLPKWVQNVNHIQCEDKRFGKEFSICSKILAGLKSLEDSHFLYMGDDHFLLEPLTEFPYYYKGALADEILKRKKDDSFRITMQNTLDYLVKNNKSTNNFDMHCPFLIDKDEFTRVMTSLNWNKPQGFGIRSIYCNMLDIEGEYYPDLKIDKPISTLEIAAKISNRKFFSTTDTAVNADLKKVFETLYPLPSIYEK